MKHKKGSNKKLECLKCEHCKTRVFRKIDDLMAWCGRHSIKPNAAWRMGLEDFGRLRLIWCELQTNQYNSHGFSPRNASPRHTADIDQIQKEEKKLVFISNNNKKPFIHDGAWTVCPFKS